MFKKFKTKELIFLTFMGAFMFLADWFIAAPITAATGISGTGGLVSTLLWTMIVVFGALVIRKPGAITLMHLVYGFLTILAPITLLPGIFKIILFGSMGIITEIILFLSGTKKFSYYLSFILGHLYFFIVAYALYTALGIPTTSQVKQVYYMIVLIPLLTLVVCGLGVFFAYKLHNKLKHKTLIKQTSS